MLVNDKVSWLRRAVKTSKCVEVFEGFGLGENIGTEVEIGAEFVELRECHILALTDVVVVKRKHSFMDDAQQIYYFLVF